jgi:hypothetical protein
MHFLSKSAVLPVMVLLLIPLAILAQINQKEQQPRFKVRVNLVSLDVEVLDKAGNPVPGLTKKDFAVKENGRPMEISNFAWQSDRPVSLAIVLDTSTITTQQLSVCKSFIVELAYKLTRTDDLCLVSFDSRDAYLEQGFTARRVLIMDALDNIGVVSGRTGGILSELFGADPRTALAIDMALHRLRKTDNGKKALLVISNRFRGLGPATVEHVQLSGCTLLTLGFGNKAALLVTLGGDKISKNQLMRESGGRQFSAEVKDISDVCRQITYSLKNYYALGYLTEIGLPEKKPRRIEVRVPGQNYTINYRRSYAVQ